MIEWKIKGLYKSNAETIYNEIMSIGETVKPSDVVELARDENTALHNLFTWDDSVAAERYREHEAGCIPGTSLSSTRIRQKMTKTK